MSAHHNPDTPDDGAVIDRLYEALARGDLAAARACCTPDVIFWHSFDRIELGLDAATQGWEELVANFPARSFIDVRREPIAGGFVQRHQMIGKTQAGAQLAWPLAIFVTLKDGLIARLDEYIDRAGHYPAPDAAALATDA